MFPLRPVVLLAALLSLAAPVAAQDIAPAVVYDVGGRFDAAFNELVHEGVERFTTETGIAVAEAEPADSGAREEALRRFAEEGRSPILAVGFAQSAAVTEMAAAHPELEFTIVDVVVDLPNVQSIVFREQEGAFLVGMLAAMASHSHVVGFIGGVDQPVIRAFACGYVQGVHHANPRVTVLQVMAGDTDKAWSDPLLGAELARQQIDQNADVVFHAAGGTGLGVLQAMAEAGRLGIGVDSNQNGLFPGSVLTSMEKRVDVAAYTTLMAARDDTWKPGIVRLGLAEGGVDWALDDNNRALVTDAMEDALDEAKEEIIAGRLTVHDWRHDASCPD